MEGSKNKWKGLRAIAVVRQSNDKDGTASAAAQLDFMKKDLTAREMRVVDAVVLEGVAASAPARINEVLERLFKRKGEKNDFDVIAWMVEDRASRGGSDHGMWMEHECKRQGLKVYFAGDDMSDVPFKGALRAFQYEAAMETSVSTGRRSTQGQEWAKEKGAFRTGGPTPLGCDRVYYGADDQPKFVIDNLLSGLQEQREWGTGKIIGTYGTIGQKSHHRFKKQRNEYSLLIPGDREERRIVRIIFYLRYKKSWRGCRIAGYLNRLGVPSPRGKQWSQRQVQIIYENESYTGVSTNNRTYSGRFFRRDRERGFVALDRDECELVLKKTFSPKVRPSDEWDRIDQPHMYDFLPRDVRDLAVVALADVWRDRGDPARARRRPPPRLDAANYVFLLSDRLRAAEDGETLVGTLSGPPGKYVPYYRHRRSKRGRLKGTIFNHLIPAKPLHEEIVRVLAEVLGDAPDLRERLSQHLVEQRAQLADRPDVSQLEAEREELKARIATIVASLSGAALADARGELERLGARRNAVEGMLAGARSEVERDTRPVEQVVEEAMAVLTDDAAALLTLAAAPLHDLVSKLIIDGTVDMATKDVTVAVALPTWTLAPQLKSKKRRRASTKPAFEAADALCPTESSR